MKQDKHSDKNSVKEKKTVAKPAPIYVYQCDHCLTIYDPVFGEAIHDIKPGTGFDALPPEYSCPLCEGSKDDFKKIEKSQLGLQAV